MKPLVYKKAKRVRHQAPVRQRLHITKGDTVQVISGDDKGKRGKVLQVHPQDRPGQDRGREHRQAAPAAPTQTAEGGIVSARRRSITRRRC